MFNFDYKLLNIGFGNSVLASRIVSIINPNSAPSKRLREEAKEEGRLIDATQGRKARAIVVTDSNHIILAAIQADTLGQRLTQSDTVSQENSKKTSED